MLRYIVILTMLVVLSVPGAGFAQDSQGNRNTGAAWADRSATGGAQTLEDILRRQRGEKVDDRFRSDNIGGDAVGAPGLAPLGGASDAELWRALRYGKADVTASSGSVRNTVLFQDGGMAWHSFRTGPLSRFGGWLLGATIVALLLFFLIRGRVRIDGEPSGRKVTRFAFIERFSHWLLAGSFVLLGLTGLLSLFGRRFIAPYLGKEANATLLSVSKFIHNNLAWAFILGLVLVFFLWVRHNLPNRLDLVWFAQGGGIIGNRHPPAKKFNAGQKLIFWSVILVGGLIALTGVSLLFPFGIPLFSGTFQVINDIGMAGWFGQAPLPETLAPQEEMQLAQVWHTVLAFVLIAIIIAHIYIGSIGMEGAFDAMGTGEVDEAWANQHHSVWLDEVIASDADAPRAASPAE